jgi:hypothetical protein
MTTTDDHALELHLARCACGWVASARTQLAMIDALYTHIAAAPLFACDAHYLSCDASSPDPVAAKLLLGAQ